MDFLRIMVAIECILASTYPTVSSQGQIQFVEEYRFGEFTEARGISTGQFSSLYVSDAATHEIIRYNVERLEETRSGGQGWGANQFDSPCGIDARLGIVIYVADKENHRIVRLDKDLNYIGGFSTRDDPQQSISFGFPLDVAISMMGNLYILDGENNRVLSSSGFAAVDFFFGGMESGAGRLQAPVALAIDGSDNVFVLERDRVVSFDGFGNYRFTFGKGIILNGVGISIRGSKCFVTTTDRIIVFQADGSPQANVSKAQIAFAEEVSDFVRAISYNDKLLLLTKRNIIVLSQM